MRELKTFLGNLFKVYLWAREPIFNQHKDKNRSRFVLPAPILINSQSEHVSMKTKSAMATLRPALSCLTLSLSWPQSWISHGLIVL